MLVFAVLIALFGVALFLDSIFAIAQVQRERAERRLNNDLAAWSVQLPTAAVGADTGAAVAVPALTSRRGGRSPHPCPRWPLCPHDDDCPDRIDDGHQLRRRRI